MPAVIPFDTSALSPLESAQLSAFYETLYAEGDEGALWLAAHASFPVVITEDLLYKIWLNFRHDEQGEPLNIPPVAVSDVLLSGLFREIGRNLFELTPGVRQTLLAYLERHERFGVMRIRRLAFFLRFYLRDNPEHIPSEAFRRAQEFAYEAELDPEKAARTLLEAWNRNDNARLQQLEELARTQRTASTTAKKEAAAANPLQVAVDLVRSIRSYQQGRINQEEAVDRIRNLRKAWREDVEEGIRVRMPERIWRALRDEEVHGDSHKKYFAKIHLLTAPNLDQAALARRLFGVEPGDPGQPMWVYPWEGELLDRQGNKTPCSFQVWHWTSNVPSELDRLLMTGQGICIVAADDLESRERLTARFRNTLATHVIFQAMNMASSGKGKSNEPDPELGGVFFLNPFSLTHESGQFQQKLLDAQQSIPLSDEIVAPVLLETDNPLGALGSAREMVASLSPAVFSELQPLLADLTRAGLLRRSPARLGLIVRDIPTFVLQATAVLEKAKKDPVVSRDLAPDSVWRILESLGLCNREGNFRAWIQATSASSAFRPFRHTQVRYTFEYLPPDLWLDTLAFFRELGLDCSEEPYPATVYWNHHLLEIRQEPVDRTLILAIRPVSEKDDNFWKERARHVQSDTRINELFTEVERLLENTAYWSEELEDREHYKKSWEDLWEKWDREMIPTEKFVQARMDILSRLQEIKIQILAEKPGLFREEAATIGKALLEGDVGLKLLTAPFRAYPYVLQFEQETLLLPPFAPDLVFVPAGTFNMGSNENNDEKPIHKVTLRGFNISKYPVTVAQYLAFVNDTNSNHPEWMEKGSTYNVTTGTDDHYKKLGDALTNDDCPIVGVSWYNAVAYCNWLSEQAGLEKVYDIKGDEVKMKPNTNGYRLLTEAEWEYAARGGQEGAKDNFQYAGSNNIEEVAWYVQNSGGKTHPVGLKHPNQLGLYDMSGNVWEWCEDQWHESYEGAPSDGSAWVDRDQGTLRVARGGGWNVYPRGCRAACRGFDGPANRYSYIGFRLARSLQF